LEDEEAKKEQLSGSKRVLETEAANVRRDMTDMEEQIAKAEAEKTSRDHNMRNLNDASLLLTYFFNIMILIRI